MVKRILTPYDIIPDLEEQPDIGDRIAEITMFKNVLEARGLDPRHYTSWWIRTLSKSRKPNREGLGKAARRRKRRRSGHEHEAEQTLEEEEEEEEGNEQRRGGGLIDD